LTVMKLEVEVPKVTLPCMTVLDPRVVVPLTLSVPLMLWLPLVWPLPTAKFWVKKLVEEPFKKEKSRPESVVKVVVAKVEVPMTVKLPLTVIVPWVDEPTVRSPT
jgi:hypothetical protein